jgi:hypothetical protein
MKIKEIIKLSEAITAEVNVLRDFSYKNPDGNQDKINGYLPNNSSRLIIKSVLGSCSEITDSKLHLITASYGLGKSYLLLIIANLLANRNISELKSFLEKIKDKDDFFEDKLSNDLDNYLENSNPFLVVIPEYGDDNFDHALLEGLKFALQQNKIDYIPNTNYEKALMQLNFWKEENPNDYERFKQLLNNSIENFILLLQSYNINAYKDFKIFFEKIVGSQFAETYSSAYPIFADTARHIKKCGYRGIAIVYDEFVGMLGKLINSSTYATGSNVQEFLEAVKDKKENCNILFISASQQDPQSLRASKEKELNKIIERFKHHQLIISEAEGEEIIATIFIKPDISKFNSIYSNPIFQEHIDNIQYFDLYKNKNEKWIESNIIKNLYPLHPLTSFILPRLSAEFAQNTRSMFNFLNPTETKSGAFRYYIENTDCIDQNKISLFTPDLLLDFFITNIKEGKAGHIQSLCEAYRVGIGKVIDDSYIKIMKNLFLLWIVNNPYIRPNREILFWAMNWEEKRKDEFDILIDDLVHKEYIELNTTDNVYQFPDLGSTPLSKIIDEESNKIKDISLISCLKVWNEITPQEQYFIREHNDKYGCNRVLQVESVSDTGEISAKLTDLKNYYHYYNSYFANGFIFYLIANSEDDLYELINTISTKTDIYQYIFYAIPNNLPQFELLIKETQYFKALENTSKRNDIIQNETKIKNIKDQLIAVKNKLEEKIKNLYDPSNWKWNYQLEKELEFTSKQKLGIWINSKIDLLFHETPKINDEALKYSNGTRGNRDRKLALDIIWNSDKDRIPILDDSSQSVEKRIIKNFFANTGLTIERKRERHIQFGEIKSPNPESCVHKAWLFIDNTLKGENFIDPIIIITNLLKEPYGLSINIIKFLFTSYIRYNIEGFIIANNRTKVPITLSQDLIERMIEKPYEFVLRKIAFTGPEYRYLGQLKSLFKDQSVNSFVDVAQKFIGVLQYMTPLHKSIIKDSGEQELITFYKSLEILRDEINSNNSDKEKLCKDYFLDILPSNILHNVSEFLENKDKVNELISSLNTFLKYHIVKETDKKFEVIKILAKDVFNIDIGTKDEITKVVSDWFKNLPAPNQAANYSDPIIDKWLLDIKTSFTKDPFELYLENLNIKLIKDWEDFSYEKHQFIDRFRHYKETVENYIKSPLDFLQIIARVVFEKSAIECPDENSFDIFFKSWWSALPSFSQAEQYSNNSNVLINQIQFSSAVKARYLETIPQAWRANGYIPEHIPSKWENWSNADAQFVAGKFSLCLKEINEWKPPIQENELYRTIGILFSKHNIEELDDLLSELKYWFNNLPERTKIAKWQNIDHSISMLITSINDKITFRSFLIEDLIKLWQLPDFKVWSVDRLNDYSIKFQKLIEKIDSYQRPINEIITKIVTKLKLKSTSIEEFSHIVYFKIRSSEAFKNKIKTENIQNDISSIMIESTLNNDSSLEIIFPSIAKILNIDQNWHLWSDVDETTFINNFIDAYNLVLKWKFPEDEILKTAKIKVNSEISKLKQEYKLNVMQIRKLLNDILDDLK